MRPVRGRLPAGIYLQHHHPTGQCIGQACCNPDHLLVTNSPKAAPPIQVTAALPAQFKTCPKGHPHSHLRTRQPHQRRFPRGLPRPPDPQDPLGACRPGHPLRRRELDRRVVVPDQIRTIVRTFRDRLFTEIFPGRTEVPKTFIFAKDDSHADDIVQIPREEFGNLGINGLIPLWHLASILPVPRSGWGRRAAASSANW
jgi:hypothetical protein